jgi:hypothetical protein
VAALHRHAIGTFTSVVLDRFHRQSHPLLRGDPADEPADAVVLPVSSFGDVGDRSSLFAAQKLEDDLRLGPSRGLPRLAVFGLPAAFASFLPTAGLTCFE